jgi:hypothetical protein
MAQRKKLTNDRANLKAEMADAEEEREKLLQGGERWDGREREQVRSGTELTQTSWRACLRAA